MKCKHCHRSTEILCSCTAAVCWTHVWVIPEKRDGGGFGGSRISVTPERLLCLDCRQKQVTA